MKMTLEEASSPVIRNLLGSDYELLPSGDPDKPLTLRCRAKLRAEVAGTLMRYSYAQRKTEAPPVVEDHGITVIIRDFRLNSPPDKPAQVIDLPAPGKPLPEVALAGVYKLASAFCRPRAFCVASGLLTSPKAPITKASVHLGRFCHEGSFPVSFTGNSMT